VKVSVDGVVVYVDVPGEKNCIPVDVVGCARCGRSHCTPFYEFTNPVELGDDVAYTHWGMCDFLAEPILMAIVVTA